MTSFKVTLPDFQGPLDLLLFFIKRDELDIYDIPIAHITKEFLNYLHMMQMLDLELAGEFIVMAATLMQIKARMLLPRMETPEGEEEHDPRAELMRRLIEYKRFKESADHLLEREIDQRLRAFRTMFTHDIRLRDPDEDETTLRDVTMFHLIKAFRIAMENIPKREVHEVTAVPYSIEEQGLYLMSFFQNRNRYNFLEIIDDMQDKMQLIVTFIALLELMRAHRVRIELNADFNDFSIIQEHPIQMDIEQPLHAAH